MTTFYSQKGRVLLILIAASFMTMINLLLPVKAEAQKKPEFTVVAVPPMTATFSVEADVPDADEVSSGKIINQKDPEPEPGTEHSLLAPPANDDCAGAQTLTSSTSCLLTSGTTNGATQSIPAISCGGFTGNADDDVWYKFTATNTTHTITVSPSAVANMDPVIDLRSGACNGVNIACSDATHGDGTTEVLTYNSFIIGNVYYIRLYDYAAGSGTFKICITEPPPSCTGDDNCACALNAANTLTPGANYKCSTLTGATVEAGENTSCFIPAPVATVWYSFIADQSTMWVAVKPSVASCGTAGGATPSSFGLAVYQSTTCFPASPAACLNYYSANTTTGSYICKLNLTGLTPGQTYMVQVAIYASCTGNNWKPFCIKIGHPSTCTTCSNICQPMCVASPYTPPPTPALVNYVTANCPSFAWAPPLNAGDIQTNCFSFVAANDTEWVQTIVYSACGGGMYTFNYTLYNNACGVISSGSAFVNNGILTPLIVGNTYKICYTWSPACSLDSVLWPFVYTGSVALPVELVTLGAMPDKEKVKIYWSTASEENAKEFIIEKTRNGMDFTEVAHVKAAGNSTRLINYKGYDDHPLRGNNYYRLKQVDFNGKFTYTKLVSAAYLPSMSAFSIVPNPAKDKAKITFNSSGNYPVLLKITGMDGKVILNTEFISVEGMNEYIIDMNKMSKGIYSVQLILDDQNQVSKLVKD